MDAIKYSIVISPENIKGDINFFPYSGTFYTENCGLATEETKIYQFGVYSPFSDLLSGGTNGSSLLTGLTIPIFLTQSINDIGYYSEFDGFILQKNVVTNFLYSADTSNIYKVNLYNTSGSEYISFLQQALYEINWGDGSSNSQLTTDKPDASHIYQSAPSGYTITLIQKNAWGTTSISKKVTLPNTGVTVNNLQGEIFFTPQGGSWSGIPLSYDYIFSGDSGDNLNQYLSQNNTKIPVIVSGFTNSRLIDLKRYGPNPYTIGYLQYYNGVLLGQVNEITPEYTAYTINNVNYYDLSNGKTFYIVESSGITSNDFVFSALTKNEHLLDFVMDPEVYSGIYVERGKYSGYEPLQRLGEVDNIGDLVRYGYGYFKINIT